MSTLSSSTAQDLDALPEHILEASGPWPIPRLGELWDYRDLAYFMIWREVKVRYKQTALGIAWAAIQPLLTMVVFSIFFGRLGQMPSDGLPYPLFAFCALLPWQLFAFALGESSNSVVTNQRLITKVYFPRLLIPLVPVCMGLADFAIAFVLLIGLMVYYGVAPSAAMLTIPFWTLMAVTTAFSVGLWLAAINVRYRDVRYTIPFLTQIWMFLSPVAYSSALIPEKWRPLYAMNPMSGVIDGFRWALLGRSAPSALTMGISIVTVLIILVSGLFYFRRTERTVADVI